MTTTLSPAPQWELHPQLASDTVRGRRSAACRACWSIVTRNYPWLVLVPRRAGVTEIIDLDDDGPAQLLDEIDAGSGVLQAVTGCDKLNIAAIGNVVPQLHVHIVARRRTDAAWPKPVWGAVPARAYEPAELDHFVDTLRHRIGL